VRYRHVSDITVSGDINMGISISITSESHQHHVGSFTAGGLHGQSQICAPGNTWLKAAHVVLSPVTWQSLRVENMFVPDVS
jgi:hypothetical protein